jgi:hypothetical protein
MRSLGVSHDPQDRFYSGLIAGIAGTVMVAVVRAGITAQVMSQRSANDSLKASQEASSGPVLGLDKDGKSSLTGWLELAGLAEQSADATGKPTDIVGGLVFYGSAVEASVTVETVLQPLIARSATITREGKPWNPPGDAKNARVAVPRRAADRTPTNSEDTAASASTKRTKASSSFGRNRAGDYSA